MRCYDDNNKPMGYKSLAKESLNTESQSINLTKIQDRGAQCGGSKGLIEEINMRAGVNEIGVNKIYMYK